MSHNIASIKQLCKTGVLLEYGKIKYTGSITETVNQYIGEGGNTSNITYPDLSLAPGNDKIRIKSFEIVPAKGTQIDIESGIILRIKFMNYLEPAMVDINLELKTLDDMTVFQVGKVIGRVGEKDAKRGIYKAEFCIPPYHLNAGKYKVEVFFGENQRYLLFGGYSHKFEVENTLSDMGYNQSVMPGIMRLQHNIDIQYEG